MNGEDDEENDDEDDQLDGDGKSTGVPLSRRLWQSVRLWSLLLDLSECYGTFAQTEAFYRSMMDCKVMTPQIAINLATYLEEQERYERSFAVLQRTVGMFPHPQCEPLWILYGTQMLRHHGRKEKIERVRDVFEQALASIPITTVKTPASSDTTLDQLALPGASAPVFDVKTMSTGMLASFAKTMILLAAKVEEEFGMISRAMALYRKGCVMMKSLCYLAQTARKERGGKGLGKTKVRSATSKFVFSSSSSITPTVNGGDDEDEDDGECGASDVLEMYRIFISRLAFFFGVTKTRSLFEEGINAILSLPNPPTSTSVFLLLSSSNNPSASVALSTIESSKVLASVTNPSSRKALPSVCAVSLALQYVKMEQQLGEIDRARAIFLSTAPAASPVPLFDTLFWSPWSEFEMNFGNKDTFRELARVKRTVSAAHTKTNYVSSSLLMARGVSVVEAGNDALRVAERIEDEERRRRERKRRDDGRAPRKENKPKQEVASEPSQASASIAQLRMKAGSTSFVAESSSVTKKTDGSNEEEIEL
eukprot:MONOS_16830.1-p1 / transcript=MONOS_16830.1 / gene=MONOS_16830 / organism=Monocercomonoides_exilis_PA203 / gene_product=pre-mRNA-splicing factor SYF1 / transcript_product=pre-mRNA-splicing factor SYF1 / location=Mono_scaffold00201:37333-38940(-) / protein_length=536 / sequence_SO=supercontig / SO=protein_coding / is_pseudo=false